MIQGSNHKKGSHLLMRAQFVCLLLTDLSIAIILGQKIGILPIHDLYIRFLGGMDIELVEHHHLLVS